jgi:iron complex outermembrane receptor protein
LLAFLALAGRAQNQATQADLTDLDLEHLMNLEVTSASKKEETLFHTAAAIFVVTQEDIRRSGATSLAEILRMAPGLNVARINPSRWAISSRGFNSRNADKLLVLMDGRSVYTPTFSGVEWDVQDTLLEDVERIEIIRGPGGTLWGANAVNGVINIITKPARATSGRLVTAGAGTEENGFGAARYGGKLGHDLSYRIYGKYFNRENFARASGRLEPGGWDVVRGGFRTDWDLSDHDSLTMQGDLYNGESRRGARRHLVSLIPPFTLTFNDRTELSGGNLLARWNRSFSLRSNMAVQFYFDNAERADADRDQTSRGEAVNTFDVNFQHRFPIGSRQDVVWGMGYRRVLENIDNIFDSVFDPPNETTNLVNVFAQEEILLPGDRLRLTLGSKLEHNDYTGFEWQPTARILWEAQARHALWAAVSRAVRTPSRSDRNETSIRSITRDRDGVPNVETHFGNRNFRSEQSLAYEFGYRVQPGDRLFLDTAFFYNTYDHLETREPLEKFFQSLPVPHWIVPDRLDNHMHGEAYGVELVSNLNLTNWWRVTAAYSRLLVQLHLDPGSRDTGAERREGASPGHQFHLRSYLKLWRGLELDSAVYYVGEVTDRSIAAAPYTRFDMRLGWHPAERLEVSAALPNLFPKRHAEVGLGDPWEIKRGLYGKIAWQF